MKEQLLKRFLEYVKMDTQSDETTRQHPSTQKQLELAVLLKTHLEELGAENVRMTPRGYVFAELPATRECSQAPVLGLIAHMDTAGEASGKNVSPQQTLYQGGEIRLGNTGRTIRPEARLIGKTLITTDGTTLLGADDKAGIAEIITAAEQVLQQNLPHGKIVLGFTPDEEIGEGALFFDVREFGADFAYTVDGGAVGEIEFQNFNAAQAVFRITGNSVHPGSAKGVMRNAQKIAFEIDAMLPPEEVPSETSGFEGFYHLVHMRGTVGDAELTYLLRDHDAERFEQRKETVRRIAESVNRKYTPETVHLEIRDQYRNMAEIMERHPILIEIAEEAIRNAGLEPKTPPIRGGTDGANLSFAGLPCPNLGTGGYNFHGESEFACLEEMETSVRILLNIIRDFSTRKTLDM